MIAVVIPIKRLSDAKSRLAQRLGPDQRADLVIALAQRTISVVERSGLASRIALVTPEAGLGVRLGVSVVPDGGDLNSSLRAAAGWSLQVGANSLLILPGDLALLERNDLHALLSVRTPGISIAETDDGGTGALFLVPPDCIEPAFGPGSYERHIERATEAGLPVRIVRRQGLAFDLDTPSDLDRVCRLGVGKISAEQV